MPTLRPPRAPKLPALTEKQITEQVIGLLKSKGWLCVRLQSGLVDLPGNRKMRVGTPGLPDWICCKARRFFFLELKRPGKEPNYDQHVWLGDAKQKGIPCMWADGLGMFLAKFEEQWL